MRPDFSLYFEGAMGKNVKRKPRPKVTPSAPPPKQPAPPQSWRQFLREHKVTR